MRNQSGAHDISFRFGLVEKVVDDFKIGQSPGVPCFVPIGIEMCCKEVRMKDVFYIPLWVFE